MTQRLADIVVYEEVIMTLLRTQALACSIHDGIESTLAAFIQPVGVALECVIRSMVDSCSCPL